MNNKAFTAADVVNLVDVSYRQLDYWERTDILSPSITKATGSGSKRLYSAEDVVKLRIAQRMVSHGISLDLIRVNRLSESVLAGCKMLLIQDQKFFWLKCVEDLPLFNHGIYTIVELDDKIYEGIDID
jgi:hypothetical protein